MEPILEIRNLNSFYRQGGGVFSKGKTTQVLKNVNVTIGQGEVLGLVGESGCGKSTIGRLILGLHQSTSGEILFNGQDICKMNKKQLHDLRKDLQIIFQDPFSSLNPRMSIGEIIGEPLRIHAKAQSRAELDKEVSRLMDVVGLSARLFNAYPHELDGGKRQVVGIARAFVAKPKIVFADEPTGNLDTKTTKEVMEIMVNMAREYNETLILVTHDRDIAQYADRIVYIVDGNIESDQPNESILKKAPAAPGGEEAKAEG